MDIDRTLAGLRRQREELDKAIAGLEAFQKLQTPRAERKREIAPVKRNDLAEAVLSAIESEGKPIRTSRISELMRSRGYRFTQVDPGGSIRQVLLKHSRNDADKLVRLIEGVYALRSWYASPDELMRAAVKAKQEGL